MSKKKLIYIGHKYHKKTNSVSFLIELLKSRYEVFYMTYNDDTGKFCGDRAVSKERFDVLVLFQMPVPAELLKKVFQFDHGVYIPMYDGTGEAPDDFWFGYRDFNIINFSKTLHDRLIKMGLSSFYIQYFPQAAPGLIRGNKEQAFFWQRREQINIHTVCDLLERSSVKKIHVHQAVDPGQNFAAPSKIQKKIYQISYSSWYGEKEDMLQDVKEAAVYIAPREYEGIGMSFLEAMAMGKCVIAPDNPTMNEYITHGVNGYLYDIHDIRPMEGMDVESIQKNTYLYMKKGYKKWEKNKYDILDWLERDIKADYLCLIKADLFNRIKKNQIIYSICRKVKAKFCHS